MKILLNEGMNYCTVRPIKSQNPAPGYWQAQVIFACALAQSLVEPTDPDDLDDPDYFVSNFLTLLPSLLIHFHGRGLIQNKVLRKINIK